MEMNDLAGQRSPPLEMEPGPRCQAHVGWEWGVRRFPKGNSRSVTRGRRVCWVRKSNCSLVRVMSQLPSASPFCVPGSLHSCSHLCSLCAQLLSFFGQIGLSWTVLAWVCHAVGGERDSKASAGMDIQDGEKLPRTQKSSWGCRPECPQTSLWAWFGLVPARRSQCGHIFHMIAGFPGAGSGSSQVSSGRSVKGSAND